MELQIFGQNELVRHLTMKRSVHTHCISITNPGQAVHPEDPSHCTPSIIEDSFSSILHLKFWDSKSREGIHPRATDRTIPQMEHIESVMRYVESTEKDADGYTIHCWRGISRSTAIAFGLLYYFIGDEQSAAEKLVSIRREAMPLRLILELYDRLFNSNLSDMHSTIYRARMLAMKKELGL
jgi:predicted protein tyrosine phosphatase